MKFAEFPSTNISLFFFKKLSDSLSVLFLTPSTTSHQEQTPRPPVGPHGCFASWFNFPLVEIYRYLPRLILRHYNTAIAIVDLSSSGPRLILRRGAAANSLSEPMTSEPVSRLVDLQNEYIKPNKDFLAPLVNIYTLRLISCEDISVVTLSQ